LRVPLEVWKFGAHYLNPAFVPRSLHHESHGLLCIQAYADLATPFGVKFNLGWCPALTGRLMADTVIAFGFQKIVATPETNAQIREAAAYI
jgi:hypothetical protein